MLKETFIGLLSNYTEHDRLNTELWNEVEKSYSNKEKHYHNLNHIENLLLQL